MQPKLILCALALALSACTQQPEQVPVSQTALPPEEAPARQTIVFLIDNDADPALRDAAYLFAEKAGDFTNEKLTVEIRGVADAANAFEQGQGDLAFLMAPSNAVPRSALLSSPLLYSSYSSMTMGLNSERLLEYQNTALAEREQRLLAGFFYDIGYILKSADPLEDEEDEEVFAATAWLANLSCESIFARAGYTVQQEANPQQRMLNLQEAPGSVSVFSLRDLEDMRWQSDDLTLIQTEYVRVPCWLAIDATRFDEFSSKYQAALREACTYLFPVIDTKLQQREEAFIREVRAAGLPMERRLSAVEAAAEAELADLARTDFEAQYILDLLQSMQ